ncbi:hypothetical protein M3Y98_01108400 [Aphelenchoides besseyi]|nr:hypothetical protein M3Y98_01104500 [Aphelenchoides besseyi]KAI6173687.1 hypothetical protein M3Y98_01108400 [Aphelenchoides besseyi]KAI6209241.1 hypothetical protein M3Y96_00200700 [Aphelenchoides besseyi]KAI6209278.1 hypothetical protein M3Y96_00204900 [Aphelenchoides besseyi]
MTDQQQQVDLSQLFSDVSRTVSGIRDFLGRPVDTANAEVRSGDQLPQSDTEMPSSSSSFSSGSPLAGIFGGQSTCFKACGMDDIQWAAKRAGELFITLRTCAIIMTIFVAILVVLLSIVVFYLTYKHCRQELETPDRDDSTATNSRFIPNAISLFQRRSDRPDTQKPSVQVHS